MMSSFSRNSECRPAKKGAKKPPLCGSRLNRSIRNEMYMQINLQDLEAYTQQIVDAERQRRFRTVGKTVCGLLWIGLVVGWTYRAQTGNPFDQQEEEEDYTAYPLTTCEQNLLRNGSFHDLVRAFQDQTADERTHCRLEFPDCDWTNPTVPEPQVATDAWNQAFAENLAQVNMAEDEKKNDLDVVLVGGSLVEHMAGKELGRQQVNLKRDQDVFETLFTRQGGGSIDGLALGIGGDRSTHLLYRLQNGELTYTFRPKVWWVIIGSQDWTLGVAAESIVAGIISIVTSIRRIHPEAMVVINSLLPHDEGMRSIQQVNQMLGCYVHAQSLIDQDKMRARDNETSTHHYQRLLHFFNATNLFLQQTDEGTYQVNPAYLLPGKQQVDAHGEWLWGQKIVNTVQQLIDSQKQQQHQAVGKQNGNGRQRR